MDNLTEVLSLGQHGSNWLSIFCVKELMRQDETERALPIKQAQSLLHEHDVNIIVTRTRRSIRELVEFHLEWRPLLQYLNADVWRVSNYAIKSAIFDGIAEALIPVKWVDPFHFLGI